MRPGAELDESRKSIVEAIMLRMRIVSTVAGRVDVVSVRQSQKSMPPRDVSNGPMTFATKGVAARVVK